MCANLLLCFFIGIGAFEIPAQTPRDLSIWEPEIKAFEASDRTNPPPQGAILFVGSSSIRIWKTLAQDFPGHQVINRGFGGSKIADSTAFADRIIVPYHPSMVALYAGDNDLAAGNTPAQVVADYRAFVRKIRAKLPDATIAFISIKPSPSRWHLHDKMQAANHQIASMKGNKLIFIDVYSAMLGADGKPRPELFLPDGLHMNAAGYRLWTSIIEPRLK